jgi:hypothetical protein
MLQKSLAAQHATLQFSRVSHKRVKILVRQNHQAKVSSCAQAGRRILPNPFASRLSHEFEIPLPRIPSSSLFLSLFPPSSPRSLPTPCSSNRMPGACKFASGRGSRAEGSPSSPDGEAVGGSLRSPRIKRAATAPPPLSSPHPLLASPPPPTKPSRWCFFPSQIPKRPAAPASPLAAPPHTLLPPPTYGSHLALLTPRGG